MTGNSKLAWQAIIFVYRLHEIELHNFKFRCFETVFTDVTGYASQESEN